MPMRASSCVRALGLATLLAWSVACATARNYEDAAGPILLGHDAGLPSLRDDVRIVTFNIKFGAHIDRAVDLLSRPGPLHGPDLLFVQETDGSGTEALARALGMNFIYVPAAVHPSSGRDLGVAILSPWDLVDARKILLPHPHRMRKMRRVAVVATAQTPAGPVRAYSVHLETLWGGSGRVRRDQARTVADDAAGWTGPVVVAGDFNGTAGADEMARAGFTWLTRDVHDTNWIFDFDHILVRGMCAAGHPPAAKAPDLTNASDHLPVWAAARLCGA